MVSRIIINTGHSHPPRASPLLTKNLNFADLSCTHHSEFEIPQPYPPDYQRLSSTKPEYRQKMPCETATKWLVPDAEWYALENDYAVVKGLTKTIRRDIDEGNNDCPPMLSDGSIAPIYFSQLIAGQGRWEGYYEFATTGRMLWADVDDSKPEHKNEVQEASKTIVEIDRDNGPHAALWKEAMDILCKERVPYYKEDEEETKKEDVFLTDSQSYRIERGELRPELLNLMLTHFKEPEKKQQMIELVTDQADHTFKRPLMILVGLIDSVQTPIRGEKKGWTVGYDIIKDVLICKPFSSSEGKHPLGDSWYVDVAEDGVSFSWSPKAFVEEFLKLGDTLNAKLEDGEIKEKPAAEPEKEDGEEPDLELSDILFAFRLVVHTVTAKFILKHWTGFVKSQPDTSAEEAAALFIKVKDTKIKIKRTLRRIQIPVVAKAETPDKKLCVCAVEEIEWELEEHEDYVRRAAVMAKEQGHEKVAENLAMLFEKMRGLIKAFIEDPEKDME